METPVNTIRFGLIKDSISNNNITVGERHAVTVVRLFRDGDVWKESTRLGKDDLLVASKVLGQTHSWIIEAHQKEDGNHAYRTNS